MAAVLLVLFIVVVVYISLNTGNTKKNLDIRRANAARATCPHCHEVGATLRSPVIGMLKVLSLGIFALAFPGSRRCNHCSYKW